MMIRIAFVCNWGHSSEELLIFLARQTPGGKGFWNQLEGVASPQDADYLVVLEDLPSSIRRSDIDLQRTIFLPREPAPVRARKEYESYRAPLAFTHHDIHQASVWRIMRPFEELESLEYWTKPRLLSTVTSAASQTKGHRLRVQFVRTFAGLNPGTLDVYGYGWNDELGASYKGEIGNRFAKPADLAALCKLEGLKDYRYSLSFENCRQNNYFSEKIVDCWLTWTMPIYWGCPNLGDYFPKQSFYEVDPTKSDSVNRVSEIIARPIGETEIEAMRQARHLILQRYNIWPTVSEIIEGRRPNQHTQRSLVQRIAVLLRNL